MKPCTLILAAVLCLSTQACATPAPTTSRPLPAATEVQLRLHWIVNPRVAPPGEPWTELLK